MSLLPCCSSKYNLNGRRPAKGAKYAPRRGKREKHASSSSNSSPAAALAASASSTAIAPATPVTTGEHSPALKRPIAVGAARTGSRGARGGDSGAAQSGARQRARPSSRPAALAHRGQWKKQQPGAKNDVTCGPLSAQLSFRAGASSRVGRVGQNTAKGVVAARLEENSSPPSAMPSKPSPSPFSRESEEEGEEAGKVVPVLQHKRRGKKRPSCDAVPPSSSPSPSPEKEEAGGDERRGNERRPTGPFASGDVSAGGRGRGGGRGAASDDGGGGTGIDSRVLRRHEEGDDGARRVGGSGARKKEEWRHAGSGVRQEEKANTVCVSSFSSSSSSSSSPYPSSFSQSTSPEGGPSSLKKRDKRRRVSIKIEAIGTGGREGSTGPKQEGGRLTHPANNWKEGPQQEDRRSCGRGKSPPQASDGRDGREGLAGLWGACRTVSPLSEEQEGGGVTPRVRALEPTVRADVMGRSYYFRTHMGPAAPHPSGRLVGPTVAQLRAIFLLYGAVSYGSRKG